MKNYVDDIRKKIAKTEEENSNLQKQIEGISDQIRDLELQKKSSLAKSDNESFLSLHRQIQSLEKDQSELKVLLKEKKAMLLDPEEIVDAWNKTVSEFETERKKRVGAYHKAKKELAQMYLELCREERDMRNARVNALSIAKLSPTDTHARLVPEAEKMSRPAYQFMSEEIGVNAVDWMNGKF